MQYVAPETQRPVPHFLLRTIKNSILYTILKTTGEATDGIPSGPIRASVEATTITAATGWE